MELCKVSSDFDAHELNCYISGPADNQHYILVILPFGADCSITTHFAAKFPLSRVITWECRGIFDTSLSTFTNAMRIHVEDGVSIIRSFQLDRFTLVGYCSGAALSLLLLRIFQSKVSSAHLVSGEFSLKEDKYTTLKAAEVDSLLKLCARDISFCDAVSKSFREMDPTEDEYSTFFNTPYFKGETLYRYANNYLAFIAQNFISDVDKNDVKTFFYASVDDTIASASGSEFLSQNTPKSSIRLGNFGDHYQFCSHNSKMQSLVIEDINKETGL